VRQGHDARFGVLLGLPAGRVSAGSTRPAGGMAAGRVGDAALQDGGGRGPVSDQALGDMPLEEALAAVRLSPVDSRELARALLKEFGGVEGLARDVRLEYSRNRDDSPAARVRLLIAVVDLIRQVGDAAGGADSLDELPDEDLTRLARQAMRDFGVLDGSQPGFGEEDFDGEASP